MKANTKLPKVSQVKDQPGDLTAMSGLNKICMNIYINVAITIV